MTTDLIGVAQIHARDFWSPTGIQLEEGVSYQLDADGTWVDGIVPCDADGYSIPLLRPFEEQRRAPGENWFKLMGTIDERPDLVFPIGRSRTFVAPASGQLTCFPNDLPQMYWNNIGYVTLRVTL